MPCDQKSQNIFIMPFDYSSQNMLLISTETSLRGNWQWITPSSMSIHLLVVYEKEYADVAVINLVIKIWNTRDYDDLCRQHVVYFSKLRKKMMSRPIIYYFIWQKWLFKCIYIIITFLSRYFILRTTISNTTKYQNKY